MSFSSKRKRLVGSCISTLVSSTKSFFTLGFRGARCDFTAGESEGDGPSTAGCSTSWGFNKAQYLLDMAFHPRHSHASLPFSSMTKVLRSMPRTFFPYRFLSLITPNGVQALNESCDFSESRETP